MNILLEEFYKTDLHLEKYHDRKVSIANSSYQIVGITQSGKTHFVKSYLLEHKKSSYLYIDCSDIRIITNEINKVLQSFCLQNKVSILVLDNYKGAIKLVNVPQLIITCNVLLDIDFLTPLHLYPLDYEEFLAYEHKYDSSALNHFVQLGALPVMHTISQENRAVFLQKKLRMALSEIEFDILVMSANLHTQKFSAFTIYERLKQKRKISKDKLYVSFNSLAAKKYIHLVAKFSHTRATKKVYLCDTALKNALSIEKNFARLFENMVYLELLKSSTECYYEEGIDFYLPQKDEIILCKPFVNERKLFKKLESIEAFIFSYGITKITVITMNKEGTVSHPLSSVDIVPFDIWALGD